VCRRSIVKSEEKEEKRAVKILREMKWGNTEKKIKDLTDKEIDEWCKRARYGDNDE
jgi:hypothetical protein